VTEERLMVFPRFTLSSSISTRLLSGKVVLCNLLITVSAVTLDEGHTCIHIRVDTISLLLIDPACLCLSLA
jgi:hypothetical protein